MFTRWTATISRWKIRISPAGTTAISRRAITRDGTSFKTNFSMNWCTVIKAGSRPLVRRHVPAFVEQPGHSGIDQPRFRKTLLAYDPSLVLMANVSSDRRPDPSPDWAAADYRAWEVSSAKDGGLGFVGINPKATDEDPLSWPATRNQVAMIIGSNWWAQSKKSMVRQSPENLARYIAHQASRSTHGGFAMSAGVFPGTLEEQGNGNLWEGDFHPTMIALARLLEPVAIAIKDTHPGRAYATKEFEWAGQRTWGVSTESPDRRTVYLHVLRPPTARILALGPTEDGTEFDTASARLVKGGASVPMRKNDSGYEIALPNGAEWDAVNTVIAVRRRHDWCIARNMLKL